MMKITDLSGKWHYSLEDKPIFAQPDYDHTSWHAMHIPQNWFLAGLDHHGVVWYRHRFAYAPSNRDLTPCATLRFDGVDYFADVYLNGVHLGHHEGYFEPLSFDVSDHLHHGDNLLAVRVDSPFEAVGPDGWHIRKRLIKGVLNHHDCRPGGGWESTGQAYNTGGIWNRVTLVEHGVTTIERALLHADLATESTSLHALLTVVNRGSPRSALVHIDCAPDNFDASPSYEASFPLELPSGPSDHVRTLPVHGAALWQPWDRGFPHLYRVSFHFDGSDKPDYTTIFGFRSVEVDEQFYWTVNGERYFPRGSNYIASQWLAETLFPETARSTTHPFPRPNDARSSTVENQPGWFERDVALMKLANLNIIRIHAHVLPPEFHTACDRAGIMVWQDFPLQWGYTDDPTFHTEAERQMRAMVHLLYNHPSVVTWCCHNESPWASEWMAWEAGSGYHPSLNRALDERLEKVAREIDPTRYVHRNSGTGDGHTYPGWYQDHWQDYALLPAAPFPTEYGAQGLPSKTSLLQTFQQFGADAGYAELVRFKSWLDTQPAYADYRRAPPAEEVPGELQSARQVWVTWRFHNFQPHETFREDRVTLGESLDEFIANSQAYQNRLIQYGTETYRRHRFNPITGVFQFMFVEPWPAITWAVLDYWRVPKTSYDTLRRSMQPVLPCTDLMETVRSGERLTFHLFVVNDLRQVFPGSICQWEINDENGQSLAHSEITLDLEMDSTSPGVPISGPILEAGAYRLELKLFAAGGALLGENVYTFRAK